MHRTPREYKDPLYMLGAVLVIFFMWGLVAFAAWSLAR